MRKTTLQGYYSCSLQKTARKTAIVRNMGGLKIGQNGHYAKATAFAKQSVWGQKKHAKKDSRKTLQLFYAKNGSRKQLLFEKWEDLKN